MRRYTYFDPNTQVPLRGLHKVQRSSRCLTILLCATLQLQHTVVYVIEAIALQPFLIVLVLTPYC